MPRSPSKEGIRHPLISENSEYSHSLGQKPTVDVEEFWPVAERFFATLYLATRHKQSLTNP